MTISIFLRRLHLYLGAALVPWFFMYAVGATILNHGSFFNRLCEPKNPDGIVRFEREYHRPVAADVNPNTVAEPILRDLGLPANRFFAYRPMSDRIVVNTNTFLSSTDAVYFVDEGRVQVKDLPFRWNHFLAMLHVRGGFEQGPWLVKAWAVIIDLVAAAAVTWVITGLYVWWTGKQRSAAGGVVLAAGVVCFVVLVAVL